MTVSRKSPGEEGEIYEITQSDYLAEKKCCEERTGYAEKSQEELEQQAVNEKLPSGSQSY